MVATQQRQDTGDSSGTGGGGGSGGSAASRGSRMGSQHRSKSGTALSRGNRSGSRTSLASHGRQNSSHRLSAATVAAAAAGLTMTRTDSSGPTGGASSTAKAGSSAGSAIQQQPAATGDHPAESHGRSSISGAPPPLRRGSSGGSVSANAGRPTMSNIAGPVPSAPRRGIPPAKKPVKFTMGADEEDEESASDEWSEDDQPTRKMTQSTERPTTTAQGAPQIPTDSHASTGAEADYGRKEEETKPPEAGEDDGDDDAWSSDEPTEEELAREAQKKAAEEREKKRREEERRQRELFQKVEVPLRSASAADMTSLGRGGPPTAHNGHYQPGAMGPPMAPPPRSLLSTMFNSEQENQIRQYRLSRMMGGHAEAEQVRKAQIAAYASQPHLPQHAQEQARARAQAQGQAQNQAQSAATGQPHGRSRQTPQAGQSQQRPSRPLQQQADRDRDRRSSSIMSNSSMDLNMLRTSKSAVALPLLSKLELKSRTSQGAANGSSGSYLRRTPSDAGSGSMGSGSRSIGEKAADPILRLEPLMNDEQISGSLSNRSLREQRNGQASGEAAPTNGSAAGAPNSAAGRSKSVDRRRVAAPMQAPSVAAHRHSSTALDQLDNGNYANAGEEGYEFVIPAGAIAQTPRTTRRNMLRDELSESVRANLLWERQSRTRRMGSSSGLASGFATAQANAAATAPPAPAGSSGGSGSGSGDVGGGSGGRRASQPTSQGPPQPSQRPNSSGSGRPGHKNTVLSGDRLRPLTSSSSIHTSPTPYDQNSQQQQQQLQQQQQQQQQQPPYQQQQHQQNQSWQRQHLQNHPQNQQHPYSQQYHPQHPHPRRPGLGPTAHTQRTVSDNGPGSGASSSDEEVHTESTRRWNTYDYNNSFHHKGW